MRCSDLLFPGNVAALMRSNPDLGSDSTSSESVDNNTSTLSSPSSHRFNHQDGLSQLLSRYPYSLQIPSETGASAWGPPSPSTSNTNLMDQQSTTGSSTSSTTSMQQQQNSSRTRPPHSESEFDNDFD